ncbi:pyridine nucleotide-disulfide oxidoreductase [Caminibacter mediatlanticus TB-2]|uniref:Pyridine nucleotide-disulfide oxidoreductase n=1 Tax=Caminibacter mediatlanticus TB-2 TaxID=391592 RepID=A0ABX5VB87_9BACT|nr:FAD/NAD(P)-binding oxidoreductase [Caminibacter mediatlanticus]QCT94086.1 pyridine nucleotide-disulfide oxidoreductase [Caminibacter mediatlanticus TB-2]
MKRREFLKNTALLASISALPINAKINQKRVVIVGGGFTGVTCAKYLKMWGGSDIEVILVDEDLNYVSPILSNLVINNIRSINDLTFTYKGVISRGVKFINAKVSDVDTNKKYIILDNKKLYYDKLVLAPGIDFKYTNKYDTNKIPHAWIAGRQTEILKSGIENLKNNDTFIMTIPKAPYRCPPGPYERACVVADYLKNVKRMNVEVVVFDENPDVIVEKDVFKAKFREYGIKYYPNSKVTKVDDKQNRILVNNRWVRGDFINVIPNQKAAEIIFNTKVNEGDFAPVDMRSFESTLKKDVYIIGDSHKSNIPKAGHIGNGEAKICADAILRDFYNYPLMKDIKLNSACYSPVSTYEASWLAVVFKYDKNKKMMVKASNRYPFSSKPSRRNFKDMFNWAGNLFSDTFS